MASGPPGGLRAAVIRGAAWSVAMRWTVRLLGLVSTAVLARLLTPADFGLVAMAMLVVGFVDAWLSIGVDTALIQNQRAERPHYDTAWTLRIIQSTLVAGAIAVSAPLAAAYFNEPRVTPVLWVLSLGVVVAGFSNIGVIAFRKELDFHKEFRLQVSGRILGLFVTVGAALWLKTYWALVVGILSSYGITCALSYAMHSYRPRLSLARFRELWSFSQWMLVRSIGHFAEMRADEILVGGLGSTQQMGLYSVASEIGRLPGSEVASPVNQALTPGFAKLQDDLQRLAAAYLSVLSAVSTVTLPAGVGLALVAPEVVLLLLGEQWLDAVPLLVLLAIAGAIRTGDSLSVSLFLAVGRPRIAAATSWLNAALLVGIALPLLGAHGAKGVAISKVAGGVVLIAFVFGCVMRVTKMRLVTILACMARPLVASAFMAIAVYFVPAMNLGVLTDLILKVSIGIVTYCGALLLCWRIAGCPDGAERFFLDKLRRFAASR